MKPEQKSVIHVHNMYTPKTKSDRHEQTYINLY